MLFDKLSYVYYNPISMSVKPQWCSRKSQAQASSALNLQSSATLGTGKVTTHQHRLDQLEDREVRRALHGRSGKGKRRRTPNPALAGVNDDDDGDTSDFRMDVDVPGGEGEGDEEVGESMSCSKPVVIVDSGFSTTVQSPELEISPLPPTLAVVGGALRRNADGSAAAPRISKRKPKSAKVCLITLSLPDCIDMAHVTGNFRVLEGP